MKERIHLVFRINCDTILSAKNHFLSTFTETACIA